MFCAISGEVPVEPVVSKVNGHLFEKRLIEKYIKETGKCPISGTSLTEEDLIPIQANKVVRPRSIGTTSIPGLLATFQNEWDEVVLETFTLKQHLDTTRQELAQAIYQHDASCRVIARLMRERDEARAALSSLQSAGYVKEGHGSNNNGHHERVTNGAASVAMETEEATAGNGGLGSHVIGLLNEKCAELSGSRRGRKPQPVGPHAKEVIASMKPSASFTPHKAASGAIHCMTVSPDEAASTLLTGGADKEALLLSRENGRVIGKMKGHSKKVTSVAYHPSQTSDIFFTASADKSIKVWKAPESAKESTTSVSFHNSSTLDHHASDVNAISVHPTGNYLLSVSSDCSWGFWDIESSRCLTSVGGDESLVCGEFHPDGIILSTGSQSAKGESGVVKIWDVREQVNVATFGGEHAGIVTGVNFSENGYLMASGCSDGVVRIWDLRKLKCTKSLNVGSPVTALRFDNTGLYLAAAASHEDGFGVQVYAVKEWTTVKELSNVHSKAITSVQWGANSSFFATASLDRSVKLHTHSA